MKNASCLQGEFCFPVVKISKKRGVWLSLATGFVVCGRERPDCMFPLSRWLCRCYGNAKESQRWAWKLEAKILAEPPLSGGQEMCMEEEFMGLLGDEEMHEGLPLVWRHICALSVKKLPFLFFGSGGGILPKYLSQPSRCHKGLCCFCCSVRLKHILGKSRKVPKVHKNYKWVGGGKNRCKWNKNSIICVGARPSLKQVKNLSKFLSSGHQARDRIIIKQSCALKSILT